MQNKINCIYRKEFYGNPPSLTISNAAWLQETFAIDNAFLNRSPSTEFGNIRLGFLSKPLFEKGFLDSILLHKKLIESQYNSTLFVAGSTQLEISQFLNKHNINFPENFICLGVIDNDSIDSFFNHIDFLLLPTRYANEVEPLVILEAMSRGIPVLTNKRGCIGCLIPTNILPLVINPSHFVDTNFNFLESCFSNPSLITLASKNCFDKYFQLMSEAKEQSSILINALNL
jgi:glycosyltransferase involved in cell wall biosynthesis